MSPSPCTAQEPQAGPEPLPQGPSTVALGPVCQLSVLPWPFWCPRDQASTLGPHLKDLGASRDSLPTGSRALVDNTFQP